MKIVCEYPSALSLFIKNKKLHKKLYFIIGDQYFLTSEVSEIIRKKIIDIGYNYRILLEANYENYLEDLKKIIKNQNLFSQLILIELHLSSTKIGDNFYKFIQEYVSNKNESTKLLIIFYNLNFDISKKIEYSRKINEIENCVLIDIKSPTSFQSKYLWIKYYVDKRKLKINDTNIKLLMQITNNNLMLTINELEKLYINYGEEKSLSNNDIENIIDKTNNFVNCDKEILHLLSKFFKGNNYSIEEEIIYSKLECKEIDFTVLLRIFIKNIYKLLDLNISFKTNKNINSNHNTLSVKKDNALLTHHSYDELINMFQMSFIIEILVKSNYDNYNNLVLQQNLKILYYILMTK